MGVVILMALACAGLVWAEPTPDTGPTDQTLIYYNARMALREGEPEEAVRLWLLRNAVEDHTDQVSTHDPDFLSVTWAALGDLGICQDGHPTDEEGAGLWPVAMHNWVVANRDRKRTKRSRPFAAFRAGLQQQFVSIGDVLSTDQMSSLELLPGPCVRPNLILVGAGESVYAKLSDEEVAAKAARHLLERSLETLDERQVIGWAAIEARLFDIELFLTDRAAEESRYQTREQVKAGQKLDLSDQAVDLIVDRAPAHDLPPGSPAARILRRCMSWPIHEWMALSAERRLFLFEHATPYSSAEERERVALGILDALVQQGDGAGAADWIAQRGSLSYEPVWAGERGEKLLGLDPRSGFDEQAVIALHRGVRQLESGDLHRALRSFGFALRHAPDSSNADQVRSLSLRWVSYVAAQYDTSDDLLLTLQELLPARDYSAMLEDLMWAAALRADYPSYERGMHTPSGRGALTRRLGALEPVAKGDITTFTRAVADGLADRPGETLRFLDQFLERLELEDADVRAHHIATLANLRAQLEPIASDQESRRSRPAQALLSRSQSILTGLGAIGVLTGARDRVRGLDPSAEAYAGTVRLAPADPLPWPFRTPSVRPPEVFAPLELTPEEWRNDDGELVFGWRISG